MTPQGVVNGTPTARAWGPARQTLRALLARNPGLGLSACALEALVCRMEFVSWRPGEEVTSDHQTDGIRVVVGGVVKIVCESLRGAPITVELVGPGGFLHLVTGQPDAVWRVHALAHTPALVGILADSSWREVACHMRVEEGLRLAACAWQMLSRRLYEKCALLAQPIRGRVLHELRVLAHEFGSPHPAGICIDLPLSHADLASLVGAARANVTRAVGALRADGLLAPTPGRLVLTGGVEGHA
jgi:CRP/FNR family transcriptional regulator, cyclic AMP receptor protein